MRVTTVLPGSMNDPVGGYLVHYRYAETMAAMGHTPTIIHPWSHFRPPLRQLPTIGSAMLDHVTGRRPVVPWHTFAPGVRVWLTPWLSRYILPRADITVLSGWQTSERIRRRTPSSGPLVQLVYDYELWAEASPGERQRIADALSQPQIVRIAGSHAVAEMLAEIGASFTAIVTPGLDNERFRVIVPPTERDMVIGFPARPGVNRGLEDAIAAFEIVRQAIPRVEVRCFGNAQRRELPPWIHFAGYLSDTQLPIFYNKCAIFVLPSRVEGWGLPAAEAMASGAAVVTTANRGTEAFAVDGVTALVVPPRDPAALASAILRLFGNPALRIALARSGVQRTSSMSWERSTRNLLAVLEEAVRKTS